MNKKLSKSAISLSALALLSGGIFFGGKYIIETKDMGKTYASKKNSNFDAKNLEDASKEEIDKMLNKSGEKLDDYTFIYASDDLLYLDENNKCISLCLSTWVKEKNFEIVDDSKIMEKFGIELEGSTGVGDLLYRKYSSIKNFNGEVELYYNENNKLEKIIFYPNGSKAVVDFVNRINGKDEVAEAPKSEPVKENIIAKPETTPETEQKVAEGTTEVNNEQKIEQANNTKQEEIVQENKTKEEVSHKIPDDFFQESYGIAADILNNDYKFIEAREKERNGKYVFGKNVLYKSDSEMITRFNEKLGIEKEDYNFIVARNINVPESSSDIISYIVGVNSGNIIIIPHQGSEEAYQIKDNAVVKVYSLKEGESHKWRE